MPVRQDDAADLSARSFASRRSSSNDLRWIWEGLLKLLVYTAMRAMVPGLVSVIAALCCDYLLGG
jgi:hypothetical protein